MTSNVLVAARHFHGTVADLAPGARLVPGNTINRSAHGYGHRSDHVYLTSAAPDDSDAVRYAIAEAEEWGCYAADIWCEDQTCPVKTLGNPAYGHVDAWRDGEILPCVRVYEVTPDEDTLEHDDSTDVTCGGVRTATATIVERVL